MLWDTAGAGGGVLWGWQLQKAWALPVWLWQCVLVCAEVHVRAGAGGKGWADAIISEEARDILGVSLWGQGLGP